LDGGRGGWPLAIVTIVIFGVMVVFSKFYGGHPTIGK